MKMKMKVKVTVKLGRRRGGDERGGWEKEPSEDVESWEGEGERTGVHVSIPSALDSCAD